jgi:23S rRNA pseudouridine1911/1915/1917 synthase
MLKIYIERYDPMPVRIRYMDNYLIICEKPVGISSESPGLPDLLLEQTGKKVFPVHRLDRSTGGLIISAFSPDSCSSMQRLFQLDQIEKEYLAVVSGKPSEMAGFYHDLLYHDKRQNKTYIVKNIRKGVKDALCEWNILQTVPFEKSTLSLIKVMLHSGRTHQIRVQFGSRRMPLVGDRKYGSRISSDAPALWSCSIRFSHPCAIGQTVAVSSFPPSVFPWNLFETGFYE